MRLYESPRINLMAVFYKKELIFDRVTNAFSMLVVRRWNVVQIRLMAVYKKELTSDKVTNTLSMFVERHCNAVQICLMAVI